MAMGGVTCCGPPDPSAACIPSLPPSDAPRAPRPPPPVNDYLNAATNLNQLLMMAKQLGDDAMNLGDHKYIAHQIALLYVSTPPAPPLPSPHTKRMHIFLGQQPFLRRLVLFRWTLALPCLDPSSLQLDIGRWPVSRCLH